MTDTEDREFQDPPESGSEGDGLSSPRDAEDAEAAQPDAADEDDLLSGVDRTVLAAKQAIDDQIQASVERDAASEFHQAEDGFSGIDVVQGTAIGVDASTATGIEGVSSASYPGESMLMVFVAEPISVEALRGVVVEATGIEEVGSDELPMTAIVTGLIDAQPHRFRVRPAPGGVSVGHHRITAGTIGCLATGRSSPRNTRRLVLSNNHVLANENMASFGDCITQPGPLDGGRCSNDQIGILERVAPIRFGGAANTVDCATAWVTADRVRREIVYIQGGTRRFLRIGSTPIAPSVGMIVGKSGRTTQLTQGRVTGIAATVRVNYRAGVAVFYNQISIQGINGQFSSGGDSGSSIWTWNTDKRPVGLLFAGGGSVTFANRMSTVLTAMDARLTT